MNIPGVAIGIISDFDIASINTHGYANKEKKSTIKEDTIFQVASISKTATAWGIMKLVENNLLQLNDPIEKYLTRWHLPPSKFNHDEITIKRVLSNSGGLSMSGYSCIHPDLKFPTPEQSLSGLKRKIDENEMNYIKQYDLDPKIEEEPVRVVEQPGKQFIYSNRGFSILALIIEELTNKKFSTFMKSEIFKPLGMLNSTFKNSDFETSLFATPYDEKGKPLPQYRTMEKAAGGLCTTIRDLTRFTLSGMKGPKEEPPGRGVLLPNSIQKMYDAEIYAEDEFGYKWAYGLGHYTTDIDGNKAVMHSGGIIGWRSMMLFFPHLGEGIVVLVNSSGGNPLWANLILRWTRTMFK
jgi:CubicO group peptidase (beta-lactamase class C family)